MKDGNRGDDLGQPPLPFGFDPSATVTEWKSRAWPTWLQRQGAILPGLDDLSDELVGCMQKTQQGLVPNAISVDVQLKHAEEALVIAGCLGIMAEIDL